MPDNEKVAQVLTIVRRFLDRDPGDRFLLASAKVYDLTLVTADERLIKAPGVKVLANI